MRLPSDIRAPIPVLHLSLDAQWEIPPPAPGFSVYWRDDVPVGAVKAFNADTFISDCAQFGKPATVPAPPFGRGPPASVIICTRDRPDQLARCLVSFKDQTVVPSEVIVIDNASVDDRTRNVALKAGVRYIREDRPGLDIARNTGAAVASCPILVYTDDDTVLHPAWLERMVAAFDDPAIWAVTGQVLPAELETAAQAVFEKAWGGLGKGYERRDYGPAFYEQTRRKGCPAWEIGAGASMAFRREVFDRLGGFDERLDVGAAGCSGDSEYWHRILCAGGVCRYEPSAVLYHYHQREFEGLARQLRAYMRSTSPPSWCNTSAPANGATCADCCCLCRTGTRESFPGGWPASTIPPLASWARRSEACWKGCLLLGLPRQGGLAEGRALHRSVERKLFEPAGFF
jgi:GT2 family glycosyltransferase